MKSIRQVIEESLHSANKLNAGQLCTLFEGIMNSKGDMSKCQKYIESVISKREYFEFTPELWNMFGKFYKDIDDVWFDNSDELWGYLEAYFSGEGDAYGYDFDLADKIHDEMVPDNRFAIVGYDTKEGNGDCFSIVLKNKRAANALANLLPTTNIVFGIF